MDNQENQLRPGATGLPPPRTCLRFAPSVSFCDERHLLPDPLATFQPPPPRPTANAPGVGHRARRGCHRMREGRDDGWGKSVGPKGTPCLLRKDAGDFNHGKRSAASVCLVSPWVPTRLIPGLLGMTPLPPCSLPPGLSVTDRDLALHRRQSGTSSHRLPTPPLASLRQKEPETVKRQTANWKQLLQHGGLSDNVTITSTG